MDILVTEEQQLETLRKWWKQNGLSVLIGAALGVAAIGGWKYWQHMQKTAAEQASDAYEEVVALANDASKSTELIAKAESLVSNHKDTTYAAFAQLFLAREAVKANDLPKAASLLEAVSKSAPANIAHVATVRLARVKIAQNDFEAALKLVEVADKDAGDFAGSYALVRGQALLKLNREAEANAEFAKAALDKDGAAEHPALNLLQDSTSQPSLVAAEPVAVKADATVESGK